MSSAVTTSDVKTAAPAERRKSTDSLLLCGVFAILMFGPLAFDVAESWSIWVLEAGAILLFVLWTWRQAQNGELRLRENPLYWPMAAFGATILVQLGVGLTAYWHDTFSQALLYTAYAVLAFLASQCLRKSEQAKPLAIAVCVYGVGMAIFGLLQGLSNNGKIYWIHTPAFGGWIYGPYVNHNHYAGLMEMLVPVPLVFCMTRYAHGRIRILAAASAALMAGTIFFSGSRGGMIAIIVEFFVLAGVLIGTAKKSRMAGSVGIFALMIVGLLIWIGGAELTRRVATIGAETRQEVSGGTRWTINKDGMHMFMKRPILGWGLGTFPIAYPQFRTFYTNFFVNEAHNDYLQLLVETGVVGFAIMVWFQIMLFRTAFAKLRDWPDEINGAVALACLLGCVGILVHSFVDFNLQVPPNAAWFYVLCVVAAARHPIESRRRIRRSRSAQDAEPELSTPSPS